MYAGQVGLGAGALGDIYGPGTSTWAVCYGDVHMDYSESRETVDDRMQSFHALYVFRTESYRIADTASVVLNTKLMHPQVFNGYRE